MKPPSNALDLFRAKEYEAACRAYRKVLENSSDDKFRYRNLNNMMVCLYFAFAESNARELFEEFKVRLKEYIDIAEQNDTTEWANNIIEDLLHYAIDMGFIGLTQNKNSFGHQTRELEHWFETIIPRFIQVLTVKNKRDARLFYDAVIRTVFRERANFERPGNVYQNTVNTKVLVRFFLKHTEKNGQFPRSRSSLFVLLSELVYSDPEAENQDYYFLTRKAVKYLDKSLEEFPANPFAAKRRSQLIDSLTNQEQLHRFDHDVSSKISSLTSLIKRIKRKVKDLREPARMERIIRDMDVILSLSRGEGPAPEEVDLIKMWNVLVNESPVEIAVNYHGRPRKWLSDQGYLKLIFENLIKNSREAYERRGINLPSPAVSVMVNFDMSTITLTDQAGGILQELLNNNRLFAPYVSEKGVAQGTGLGLSLVKKTCDMLSIDIDIKSKGMITSIILTNNTPHPIYRSSSNGKKSI